MKQQIKNRYTNEVIFECEAETLKEAVEEAVKNKIDLRYADLSFANLRGAEGTFIYNYGVKLKVVRE